MERGTRKNIGILDLSVELHIVIIQLLDPIGLIALSQTCSSFRRLINPSHAELAARLLQMECTREHGGPTPIFRARDNQFTIPERREWSLMRWACTGCLRLLPHTYFDNHSLLRLAYRKPIPGSAAQNLTTSWAPSKLGKNWGLEYRKARVALEKPVRRRYRLATLDLECLHWLPSIEDLQEAGIQGLDGLSLPDDEEKVQDILDDNARAIELERCGSKRFRRKCNECRFQKGELGVAHLMGRGTPEVPIQPSRPFIFHGPFDRYFPGLAAYLGSARPLSFYDFDEHFKFREKDWTLRMIRCPGCCKWQEMRAFRLGNERRDWAPSYWADLRNWNGQRVDEPFLNGLRCNACFAKSHGVGPLASDLVEFAEDLLAWEMYDAEIIANIWKVISKKMEKISIHGQPEIQRLIDSMGPYISRPIKRENLPALRNGHRKFRFLLSQQYYPTIDTWRGTNLHKLGKHQRFKVWFEEYDQCEAYWLWLTDTYAKVTQNPEAVASWALDRDGASLT